MNTYIIKGKPESYKPGTFSTVDTAALGKAINILTKNGQRLYCYLLSNKSGYKWTVNPVVFAQWLGILNEGADFSSDNEKRSVQRIISEGTKDLIRNSYLKKVGETEYEFYERGRNLSSTSAKDDENCHVLPQGMTKIVTVGSSEGRNSSCTDAGDDEIGDIWKPDGTFNF